MSYERSNRNHDTTRDIRCANCDRWVVEAVNYHSSLGTCVFCDLNKRGQEESEE